MGLIQTGHAVQGRHQDGGYISDFRWRKNEGRQQACGGNDCKVIRHHSFYKFVRFLLHWPLRQASVRFAAEAREEINFANLVIAVAVAPI